MSDHPKKVIITLPEKRKYTGLMCSNRSKCLKTFPPNCDYWFDNELRLWYIEAPNKELANTCKNLFIRFEKECIEYVFIPEKKSKITDDEISDRKIMITLDEKKKYTGIMCSKRQKYLKSFPPGCNYWFDNDLRLWYIRAPNKELANISKNLFIQFEKECIDHILDHPEKYENDYKYKQIQGNLAYRDCTMNSKLPREKNIMECVGKYINPLITYLEKNQHGHFIIDSDNHKYIYTVEKPLQNSIVQYIITAEKLYITTEFLDTFKNIIGDIQPNDDPMQTYTYISSLNDIHELPKQVLIRLSNLNYDMIHLKMGFIAYNNNAYMFVTYPNLTVSIQQYIKNMEYEHIYTKSLSFSYSVMIDHSFQYEEPEQETNSDMSHDAQKRIENLSYIIGNISEPDMEAQIKTLSRVPAFLSPATTSNRYVQQNRNHDIPKRSNDDAPNRSKRQKIDLNADFIPL
jgi:hypothetical protein